MADEDSIGARVAAIRKLRGWTARELARQASVSYSLLTKVESGAAPASPAFIGAVARALRVDVPRITGQPYQEPRGRYAALQASMEPLRRVLLAYDVPSAPDAPVRPAAELQAGVRAASLLGREARYVQLAERLPVLLEELQAAVWQAADADRPRLYGLLAEAYGARPGSLTSSATWMSKASRAHLGTACSSVRSLMRPVVVPQNTHVLIGT